MKQLKISLYVSFLLFSYIIHLQVTNNQAFALLTVLLFGLLILVSAFTSKQSIHYILFACGFLFILSQAYTSSYTAVLIILLFNFDRQIATRLLILIALGSLYLFISNPNALSVWSLIFTVISYIVFSALYRVDEQLSSLTKDRDQSFESMYRLEELNQQLTSDEANLLELTKLEERNRIARDIHDGVGHLLSRSIVQVGAIKISASENQKEQLELLNDSLQQAMTSIRESVHNLHDSSLNLEAELELLCEQSTIPARLKYSATTTLNRDFIYHIIKIISEAITNSNKHSNATQIKISFYEHANFYQLKCSDNGTKTSTKGNGIGMYNIEKRVDAIRGRLNINTDNGYELLIVIPKGENK